MSQSFRKRGIFRVTNKGERNNAQTQESCSFSVAADQVQLRERERERRGDVIVIRKKKTGSGVRIVAVVGDE